MRYQDPGTPSTADIDEALAVNDPDQLKRFVIGAAFYWQDQHSIETLCSTLSHHLHEEVRGNAILGFGHIARRFRTLPKGIEKVIEASLVDDSAYVRGQAWAAADDVNHFLGWKIEMNH